MKLHVVVALVALAGCDKGSKTESSNAPATAVKLSADESKLLANLPGGNVVLFGGNYLRIQKYLTDSPLSRLMGALVPAKDASMTEWMNCFVEPKNVSMLGGVEVEAGHMEMRFVMTGMDIAKLETCTKRANFPSSMDPDQKFLGVEFPTQLGPMKGGYLALGDGMIYTRVAVQFPQPNAMSIDRAMLESDIASAKTKSAADDKTLIPLITTVDRTRSMWMVASASGTPLADKFGTAQATFDIADGMALDVSAQVLDSELADKVSTGIKSAKKKASSLGGAMQTLLEKLEFKRVGDRLFLKISISNADLGALVDQLQPFMPAIAGAH